LLEIDGVVGVGVAGLAIALDVPYIHHLTGWSGTNIRFYRIPTILTKGYMEYATIYLFHKGWGRGQGAEATHDSHRAHNQKETKHQTQCELTTFIATTQGDS
jgi:hypothetical protein